MNAPGGVWVAGDHEPTRDKRQHDGGIGQIGQSGYLPVQADEVDEVHNPGGAFVVVPSVSAMDRHEP